MDYFAKVARGRADLITRCLCRINWLAILEDHKGYAWFAGNGVYAGGAQLLVVDYVVTFFNAYGAKACIGINYAGFGLNKNYLTKAAVNSNIHYGSFADADYGFVYLGA